ncbi:MAG: tetraacyldisaccharide 4'-kinase [Polyangiaceae bacterium]
MGLLIAQAHLRIATALERGELSTRLSRAVSSVFGHVASQRARRSPESQARVIEVIGATLGGSWRTPLALAITEHLASLGHEVTVLAHGYGASLVEAREVDERSDPREVGDEASMQAKRLAARGLLHSRAHVVSAPAKARSSVVMSALAGERLVVSDGPLHTLAPRFPRRTILALDARRPWGSGYCPPVGDLRAPVSSLLALAHDLAIVRDELDHETPSEPSAPMLGHRATVIRATLEPSIELRNRSYTVVTACARPDRFLEFLTRRGARVNGHIRLPDHARNHAEALLRAELSRYEPKDPLLLTQKCAEALKTSLKGLEYSTIGLSLSPDDIATLITPFLREASLV